MTAIAYFLTAVLLGSNWYATRVALHGYKPFTAAALRFAVASVIFIGIWIAGYAGTRPTRKELKWLALAGVINAVQYSLFYFALLWISGGLAAVIYGTVQLFTAVVAIIAKTERVTLASVAGAPLSLAGLAFIYWDRLGVSSSQATGVGLMFASVIVSAIGTVILKYHGRRVSPVVTTTMFLTMSAVVLGIAAVIFERDAFAWPDTVKPTVAVLYQGIIGSAAGFGIYFYLLKRITAVTAGTIAFVLPVVAIAIDWAAREPLRLEGRSYFGVALTLAGVVLAFLVKLRTPQPATT